MHVRAGARLIDESGRDGATIKSEAQPHTATERFETLTARFLSDPNVGTGTGFGSMPGLRVSGRIFAMLVKEELPAPRVDELVASGTGARFDPGHGRPMKEWVTVPASHAGDWQVLADEAFTFVDRRR